MMQRRRSLLLYMARTDPKSYVRVIEHYQIREGKGASKVSDRPDYWSPPRQNSFVAYRPKNWLEFKKQTTSTVKKTSGS